MNIPGAALRDLQKNQISYNLDHPLARYSSFKVGGTARLYVAPSSFSQFRALQQIIMEHSLPFFFLGGGSNLLISDQGFDGVVIQLSAPEEIIIKKKTKKRLWVRGLASNRSAWFAKMVSKMGFTGLEFLSTIPGSLGGAVVQNAGCYGSETKDFIKRVFAISNGQPKFLSRENSGFSYRNSLFKEDHKIWVYAVDFELIAGDQKKIQEKLDRFKAHRTTSQPRNKKSAGSVFKNPDRNLSELKAWQLIEQVNLRGKKIGGACFSEEHCNFIVNEGSAKASDIHQLILLAQKEVKEKTGVPLETEVVRVGSFEK